VELAVDIRPVNPFDFTLEETSEKTPVEYGPLARELAPYLDLGAPAFFSGARQAEASPSLEAATVQSQRSVMRAGLVCARRSPRERYATGR
jgi:hypothetical protein